MYAYNVAEWILLFFIYGFFGWIFESTYVSLLKHKFVNRGFLRGPILPIYASGAIIILFATIPFQGNFVAVYFAGMIAATLLELVVGLAMESIFKVKYWDYSNQRIQYKGVICLSSSVAWGFLSLLLTQVIHKPIEHLLYMIPQIAQYPLAVMLSFLFTVDTVLSVKAALDMRKMLEQMEIMRGELKAIEEKLVTQLEEHMESFKENAQERADAMRESVEVRMAAMKEEVEERRENRKELLHLTKLEARVKIAEYMEQYKEELRESAPEKWETYETFREKLAQYKNYTSSYDKMKEAIIKAHPSATSVKYREAYQDMKAAVEEKLHRKKK